MNNIKKIDQMQTQQVAVLELFKLASKAETLQEKLTRLKDRNKSGKKIETEHSSLYSDLTEKWQSILAGSDADDRLSKRLDWSGWSKHDLRNALAEDATQIAEGSCKDLPEWALTINEISKAVKNEFNSHMPSQEYCEQGALPFALLINPVVVHAVNELRFQMQRSEADICRYLDKSASNDLAFWLQRNLSDHCQHVLFEMFAKHRPLINNLLLKMNEPADCALSFELYSSFIYKHGITGLTKVFDEYPVLARIIAVLVKNWIDFISEFIQRLEKDWDKLAALVGFDAEAEQIKHITCGLSDAHHNGRSVMALTLGNGTRFIYKPRDLSLDQQVREFSKWITKGTNCHLDLPEVLNGDGYGWMTYAARSSKQIPPQDNVYWKNAGALLGLFYFLNGTDGHSENIVTTDDCPVLVDSEAMFFSGHAINGEKPASINADTIRNWATKVQHTSLLPHWSAVGQYGQIGDNSAFGALFSHPLAPRSSRASKGGATEYWTNINSDQMKPAHWASKPADSNLNETSDMNSQLSVKSSGITSDIINAVADGFEEIYDRVLSNLEDARAQLELFNNLQTRFIHRPTRAYDLVYKDMMQPTSLVSGLEFGLRMETLLRISLEEDECPKNWMFFADAIKQMTALDIPYQYVSANDCKIYSAFTGAPLDTTWESGLDAAQHKINRLSQSDLNEQLQQIIASFEIRQASNSHKTRSPVIHENGGEVLNEGSDELILKGVLAIAEEIKSRAIEHEDGISWITPEHFSLTGHLTPEQASLDLFSGTCGTAIFLAAVDRHLNSSQYELLWTSALQPFKNLTQNSGHAAMLATKGFGISGGVGGMFYTLALLNQIAKGEQFNWISESAEILLNEITDELISKDSTYDLIGGTSAIILGLVALYHSTGNRKAILTAVSCAEHLLKNYEPIFNPLCEGGQPWLCGMSHGASGIALALGKLWQITGDERLKSATYQALDFEDRFYREETNNWRDLRKKTDSQMNSWCHGAVGIALARLGLIEAGLEDGDGRLEKDLKRAMAWSEKSFDTYVDHPCCGATGLYETMIEKSRVEKSIDPLQQAKRIALKAIVHPAQQQSLRLYHWEHDQLFEPGFFQGYAGIGYGLLRLLNPAQHPSVLTFNIQK